MMQRTVTCNPVVILLFLTVLSTSRFVTAWSISCPSIVPPPIQHAIYHLTKSASTSTHAFKPLEEVANTKIPSANGDILAYVAEPPSTQTSSSGKNNLLILIHEFFGLNESICQKANALAKELDCKVVAPDTFRGTSTDFVPQAIWLALSTPQERVNEDLNAVVKHFFVVDSHDDNNKLAVMGFCYGGGKAIRYSIQEQSEAATVVFYGNPVTDAEQLKKLQGPVCGIYGRNDVQFSMDLLKSFQDALKVANVESNVKIYNGVGHAFWKNMEQMEQKEEPQLSAYRQCTSFLRDFYAS